MITEALLTLLFGVADGLCSALPDITWSVDTTAWQYAQDILDMIGYLLPMGHIKMIIALIFDITLIRIGISVARTIMGFIPFV